MTATRSNDNNYCWSVNSSRQSQLVMGDSAKKERFDSIQCHKRVDSIRFDLLLCQNPLDSPNQGFWTLILKLLGQSTEAMTGRPALQQSC